MHATFLLEGMDARGTAAALVWRDETYGYDWLARRTREWGKRLADEGIGAGNVVALEADFSPNAVALFLALTDVGAVCVPLTSSVAHERTNFLAIAEVERTAHIHDDDRVTFENLHRTASHDHYVELRRRAHPGLVLFSSGSTGESKAAVHDLVPLLGKFRTPRHAYRTISFLLYDHIGGVNTMLYTLANGGTLVTLTDRQPSHVLGAIERHRVQCLPTSPTFLNLVLLSGAWRERDLSCLELVTYGTEPMPASTLERFHECLPHVRLLQTYGLSEVGILRSKSESSDSLWVKVGGEDFDTRVVEGILHVRARSAMLGYLNAPSPFTEDGWLVTGDRVEVKGEYLRFLGRDSEIINVGGEKVYPAEIESVVAELEDVAQVTVFGRVNAILGQMVCARVTPTPDATLEGLAARIKKHCRGRLAGFKVPAKVEISHEEQHSARFKKLRPREARDDGGAP